MMNAWTNTSQPQKLLQAEHIRHMAFAQRTMLIYKRHERI